MKGPLFIVLNGPPECGKSTEIMPRIVSGLLFHGEYQVRTDSFAAPMKTYISRLMGMPYSTLHKGRPVAELAGYTPRDFLIMESEDHMKPTYGDDIFARMLVFRAMRMQPTPDFIVVDDSGFQCEIDAIAKRLLIRVNRPEKSFAGDSRDFLPDPDFTINNDGSLEDLDEKINKLVLDIIHHPRNKW